MGDNKETEIAVIETNGNSLPVAASPAAMMQLAMNNGLNLEKVEKMIELQAKWDAIEAEKAYTMAMAQFKKNPPEIDKNKNVNYQKKDGSWVAYNHATLGNVTKIINSELAKSGFSSGWSMSQEDKRVTVTCTITHKKGHSKSASLSAPPDDSAGKNSIQAIASTVTYLERYTLLALTGLATHDQDDDGAGAGAGPQVKYISNKQQHTIRDILISDEVDEIEFLTWAKAESIDTIPEKIYNTIIKGLEDRKKAIEKKAIEKKAGKK